MSIAALLHLVTNRQCEAISWFLHLETNGNDNIQILLKGSVFSWGRNKVNFFFTEVKFVINQTGRTVLYPCRRLYAVCNLFYIV